MPIVGNIPRPIGRGTRKIFGETATITGTGTIATGLSTVEWAIASIVDSPTTLPNQVVEISSISAGISSLWTSIPLSHEKVYIFIVSKSMTDLNSSACQTGS